MVPRARAPPHRATAWRAAAGGMCGRRGRIEKNFWNIYVYIYSNSVDDLTGRFWWHYGDGHRQSDGEVAARHSPIHGTCPNSGRAERHGGDYAPMRQCPEAISGPDAA